MKKSIIIRGDRLTKDTLSVSISSIRKWFDGELILSTWEGLDLSNSGGVDKIVVSKDPFSFPHEFHRLPRQVFLGRVGLEKSSGDVVLVTRTDLAHHTDLFKFHCKLRKNNKKYKIYDERIVIPNIMTFNPDRSPSKESGFRVSDWFHLGLKTDVFKHFDVLDEVMAHHPHGCSEQLWFISSLNKYLGLSLNPNSIEEYKSMYWDAVLNNFSVIDTYQTAQTRNLAKFRNQPENLIPYMMEKEYKNKYINTYQEYM